METRKLNINETININGGSFWKGFCAGVGAADAVIGAAGVLGAAVALNPITGTAFAVSNLACAAWGLSELFN